MSLEWRYPTEHDRITNYLGDPPFGEPGQYSVVFVLGIPGRSSAVLEPNVPKLEASGDSLVMGAESFNLVKRGPEGERVVVGHSNDDRHLGRLVATLHAETSEQAEELAHDLVMPLVSHLAFSTNVGIEIQAVITTEVATERKSISAIFIGHEGEPQDKTTAQTDARIGAFLSVYRDGLTSLNAIWQALCFYKVTEGIVKLGTTMRRAAEREGEPVAPDPLQAPFPSPGDHLPKIDSLEAERYPQHAGKPMREVWDSYTRSLRNAGAHMTPGEPIVVGDRLNDLRLCRDAIPVLRYIARRALEAEMSWLAAHPEAARFTITPAPDERGHGGRPSA